MGIREDWWEEMCKLLSGKTAIVTGSNRGIGKAICELFVKQGAFVYACARSQNEEYEKWTDDLNKECIFGGG
jgi:3-oxoacyl-[acyl-carrier protein] reductase